MQFLKHTRNICFGSAIKSKNSLGPTRLVVQVKSQDRNENIKFTLVINTLKQNKWRTFNTFTLRRTPCQRTQQPEFPYTSYLSFTETRNNYCWRRTQNRKSNNSYVLTVYASSPTHDCRCLPGTCAYSIVENRGIVCDSLNGLSHQPVIKIGNH